MNPWDDPNLMPVYHVQLETRDLVVSYEVATADYNAVAVATADLRARLRDPEAHVWGESAGHVGYYPVGDGSPVVVTWSVAKGCDPAGHLKEDG